MFYIAAYEHVGEYECLVWMGLLAYMWGTRYLYIQPNVSACRERLALATGMCYSLARVRHERTESSDR